MSEESSKRTAVLHVGDRDYAYYPVSDVEGSERLPYSLTVLLENILRCAKSTDSARILANRLIEAGTKGSAGSEIEFSPSRVLFQDFTGVPVFVDFAVMREACANLGGDPSRINPQVPCDLVIDHSVIADEAGCPSAMRTNMDLEFERNGERYEFLKWAQGSFRNVRIVPPGEGICHQLNIERFASVVMTRDASAAEGCNTLAYFDTLVGTDSHTPTANGIGVLGWGVGGIEAEAAALGQPITTLVPRVVGVELTGELPEGIAAMDVSLRFAQMLREKGVVGCFVECFGSGVANLSATQRACISNMTPEYGSTCTLFPIDDRTLEYLNLTGRSADQIALVETYAKAQGLWNDPACASRAYAEVLHLDLSTVQCSIAGPSRPHDRISWVDAKASFEQVCSSRGLDMSMVADVVVNGAPFRLTHGTIAIAAVTSCTTATDPAMMLACGLVARKASEAGLHPKPWVKTILAPGSKATELLLKRAGLLDGLNDLGFYTCGFGCMSCIGNSGPILPALHDAADQIELASVLSGNRNFEGRISPDISQNYLSAPAGVIAYALAGTMDFDFEAEPLGMDAEGQAIYLRDIWPTNVEIAQLQDAVVTQQLFEEGGLGLFDGDDAWCELGHEASDVFEWNDSSTYVRRAPYFDGMPAQPIDPQPIRGARALAVLGDFITTDHISPAGSIASDSAAATYLRVHGVADADFNTYGARRGNHEVMARGTFANVKLKNLLAEGRMGGWTRDMEDGAIKLIFDASDDYRDHDAPLVVLAGKMYGSGSSRDWAAKGPMLLGVKAAFAESFERIHRSNLIGMGILPLQFEEGQNVRNLGLDGTEAFDIGAIDFSQGIPNPTHVAVHARKSDGTAIEFTVLVRIDTPTEGAYYRNGGILQYVLRQLSES